MSSRLIRGASIPTEAMAWRRVSSLGAIVSSSEAIVFSSEAIRGAITSDGQPPSGYISEPGSTSTGSRAPGDIEQSLQSARRQGFEEGQAASRQSLGVEVEIMQTKLGRS